MNKIKPVLLGVILGIILFLIVVVSIGANVVHKVEKDYKNEVQTVANVLEKSKDPVFQIDYMLAGLNLSSQFKEYLKEGVENGWWTEEFLSQVVLDDLLPIYAKQFSQVGKLLGKTEGIEKIKTLISNLKEKYPEIVDFLKSLNFDGIKETLYKLRDAFLSLDINRLILAIQRIKDMIEHLNPDQIKDLITKIKNILGKLNLDKIKDRLNEIKDKLDGIKDKLADLKDKLADLKDKLADAKNKFTDKISEIKDKLADLKDKLENMDIDSDKIKEIIVKIKDFLNGINWHAIKVELYELKVKITHLIHRLEDLIDDIQDLVHDIINALNNLLSVLYNYIFQDVNPDHNFTADIVIGGITIPKEVLNGIDINVIKVYDNNGTTGPTNLGDDKLYITGITIAPEVFTPSEGEGLRVVKLFSGSSGNGIEITGVTASVINNQIDNINANI